jgi:hypothetical protein
LLRLSRSCGRVCAKLLTRAQFLQKRATRHLYAARTASRLRCSSLRSNCAPAAASGTEQQVIRFQHDRLLSAHNEFLDREQWLTEFGNCSCRIGGRKQRLVWLPRGIRRRLYSSPATALRQAPVAERPLALPPENQGASMMSLLFQPTPPPFQPTPPPCVRCGTTTVLAPAFEEGQRVFDVRCPACGRSGTYSLNYS